MNVKTQEIEDAIRKHDDPEHDDAATVADIKQLLADINAGLLDLWSEHEDSIDAGTLEVVHETPEVMVLADYEGHFWSEEFRHRDVDEPTERIIQTLHHEMARWHCDYSWSVASPVVVEKSDDFRGGEEHILREIARRTDETGSVARAVDQLATEVHDWTKGDWAKATGRNPSTVTRTTRPKEP